LIYLFVYVSLKIMFRLSTMHGPIVLSIQNLSSMFLFEDV